MATTILSFAGIAVVALVAFYLVQEKRSSPH